jgi:hypothetical protein
LDVTSIYGTGSMYLPIRGLSWPILIELQCSTTMVPLTHAIPTATVRGRALRPCRLSPRTQQTWLLVVLVRLTQTLT